jgi:hypothetical protein
MLAGYGFFQGQLADLIVRFIKESLKLRSRRLDRLECDGERIEVDDTKATESEIPLENTSGRQERKMKRE